MSDLDLTKPIQTVALGIKARLVSRNYVSPGHGSCLAFMIEHSDGDVLQLSTPSGRPLGIGSHHLENAVTIEKAYYAWARHPGFGHGYTTRQFAADAFTQANHMLEVTLRDGEPVSASFTKIERR